MTASNAAVAAGLLKRSLMNCVNRVPGRKLFPQMEGEGCQQHDRQAVWHNEPEKAANSPCVSDRSRSQHGHRPRPHRNHRADAKSEADPAAGGDVVVGRADHRSHGKRERQHRQTESAYDSKAKRRT